VTDGTSQWLVAELDSRLYSAQQQAPAAHVSAAHELAGKQQSIAQGLEEHIGIFARGDAAEQHDLAGRLREQADIALQRESIAKIGELDRDLAHGAELFRQDVRRSVEKSAARRDHETAAKGAGISELAAKVEAARELEELTQRSAIFLEIVGESEAA